MSSMLPKRVISNTFLSNFPIQFNKIIIAMNRRVKTITGRIWSYPSIYFETKSTPIFKSLIPNIMAIKKAAKETISRIKPFLKPEYAPIPKKTNMTISMTFKLLYDKSDLTNPEIVLPSALPANAFVAAPITLPMS